MKYTIAFVLDGFDQSGEEHRIVIHTHNPLADSHRHAAEQLVKFAARILNVKVDNLPVRRIKIKSAWQGKKRVSGKDLLSSLISTGAVAPRGRQQERVSIKPRPLGRHMGRPHR